MSSWHELSGQALGAHSSASCLSTKQEVTNASQTAIPTDHPTRRGERDTPFRLQRTRRLSIDGDKSKRATLLQNIGIVFGRALRAEK